MSRTTRIFQIHYKDDHFSIWAMDLIENENVTDTVYFPRKSLEYVESAAENWKNGILNIDNKS